MQNVHTDVTGISLSFISGPVLDIKVSLSLDQTLGIRSAIYALNRNRTNYLPIQGCSINSKKSKEPFLIKAMKALGNDC